MLNGTNLKNIFKKAYYDSALEGMNLDYELRIDRSIL